jgi:frataxin-like iron-binding protein CyaY
MTTELPYQTRINGTERNTYIFVDKSSNNEVWFSANVSGGHTHIVVSHDQAKDMIAALIRIVEAE